MQARRLYEHIAAAAGIARVQADFTRISPGFDPDFTTCLSHHHLNLAEVMAQGAYSPAASAGAGRSAPRDPETDGDQKRRAPSTLVDLSILTKTFQSTVQKGANGSPPRAQSREAGDMNWKLLFSELVQSKNRLKKSVRIDGSKFSDASQ